MKRLVLFYFQIKYKKCRLRPGAVPSTTCESMNNVLNNQEDEEEEFEVNRGSGQVIVRKPFIASNAAKEIFLIPREDKETDQTELIIQDTRDTNPNVDAVVCKEEQIYADNNIPDVESFEDTNNSALLDQPDEDQAELQVVNITEDGKFTYAENDDDAELLFVEAINCESIDCKEEEIVTPPAKKFCGDVEFRPLKSSANSGDETSTDLWDSMENDEISETKHNVYRNYTKQTTIYYNDDNRGGTPDPLDTKSERDCDSTGPELLFEDLLDVYTEVQLPSGWTSMVTSKGHGTTVVYTYMSMMKNGMPYVEKQVFLKSDMKLRCGAANKEIHPRLHNLVREGRHRTVHTLLDVEDFVEEFDQRIICEGMAL